MATIKSATLDINVASSAEMAGDGVSGEVVSIKAFNSGVRQFTSSTTPPVTMCYAAEIEFTGSSSATDTQTIDLSSFDDIEGVTKDGQGLRVQVVHVIADVDNLGDVTIGPAVSDGYDLFGSGNEVDVPPGGELVSYGNDELPEIEGDSGTLNTDIDVTGNGGDSVKVLIWLG